MKSWFVARALAGLTIVLPGAALAQAWVPASEIVGQPIQVTTNGTTNTVYLDPGGTLRIMTPGGNTVPGTWTAAGGQLCISAHGAQECVPYTGPMPAAQPLTLTSTCGATETWLAQAVNAPPPPPPPAAPAQRGERGR